MNQRLCAFLAVALTACGVASQAQPHSDGVPCMALNGLPRMALVSYLKGDRPTRDPACVLYALKHLAGDRDTADAPVLAAYLDFSDPNSLAARVAKAAESPQPVQIAGSRDIMPSVTGDYPAAAVLAEMGSVVDATLISVIGDAASSDLHRKNAISLLRLAHKDDLSAAASSLAEASHASAVADPPRSARFRQAARQIAQECMDMAREFTGNPHAEALRRRCEEVMK